jgi:hypothetical protein
MKSARTLRPDGRRGWNPRPTWQELSAVTDDTFTTVSFRLKRECRCGPSSRSRLHYQPAEALSR